MKRKASLVAKQSTKTTYAVPVTLREADTFEIPLDMSISDAERQKLMDGTGILRIAFGAELDRLAIREFIEIQCLNTAKSGKKPEWRNCLARLLHAYGNVMLMENRKRESHIQELLASVLPDYGDMIKEIRKPFEEEVSQYKLAHPDEFTN